MDFDALQQISQQFGVEKLHGQLHQFDEKVRNKRDIDACADVQQNPSPDKIDARAPDNEKKLRQQNQPNKPNVFVSDADINHCLHEKRKDKLQ